MPQEGFGACRTGTGKWRETSRMRQEGSLSQTPTFWPQLCIVSLGLRGRRPSSRREAQLGRNKVDEGDDRSVKLVVRGER